MVLFICIQARFLLFIYLFILDGVGIAKLRLNPL